jgi:hypothetical protein
MGKTPSRKSRHTMRVSGESEEEPPDYASGAEGIEEEEEEEEDYGYHQDRVSEVDSASEDEADDALETVDEYFFLIKCINPKITVAVFQVSQNFWFSNTICR